ncbi:cytochrome c biogenesis protein DipZ [Acidisoma cellulosilytica]|uniref:Cytochrome c biogenesis protein DipZ n=1 Tax=Acidisoma cellulosilyticum TaxID=2802395 RepID=A0A963Z1R0_9PROT|nr:cytochrome c biogenesis protein DipZ [Acidisoma cellulosilyticum]MCB8881155.1 cytochrome c biogenesis protein DipZ [Acidisoma cellulosilyticum]
MILFLVSYLGGVLTILSPCILPVLPFVFARADRPFVTSGLPLLLGMAITFAAVATLAAVGGGWAVDANHYGRVAAIILLALFGVTLLFPHLADRLTRPLVALGSRLSQSADSGEAKSPFAASFLLGIATGLLWAPCAGPILGLVLTGAALQGANIGTSLLLLAYAAGAATSLAVALLIGGRVFTVMKRSLGAGEWVRRGLGVAVLAGVVVISLGLDRGLLTQVASASTTNIEQALLNKAEVKAAGQPPTTPAAPAPTMTMQANNAAAGAMMMMAAKPAADALPVEGNLPPLTGAVQWLNSPPLTAEGLRGKVVLIDFWTYSCINCLRTLPYVEAWAAKYKDHGLVVIGVHSPEFAFERDIGNVQQAIKDLKVNYPVAIDNNYAIWRAFNNEYWPAQYFIDAQGRIRYHHFGEGDDAHSERVIQQLLTEAGNQNLPQGIVSVDGHGAEAAADETDMQSPETYIGFTRAANFVSPGGAVGGQSHVYTTPDQLALNQWGLTGDWTVQGDSATLNQASGSITFRFHARDLHLVLGPASDGKPLRFRVLIDGQPPLGDHGADIDAQGNGTITDQRLYQLIRQDGAIRDRSFQIQFLEPGAQAFSFTFG